MKGVRNLSGCHIKVILNLLAFTQLTPRTDKSFFMFSGVIAERYVTLLKWSRYLAEHAYIWMTAGHSTTTTLDLSPEKKLQYSFWFSFKPNHSIIKLWLEFKYFIILCIYKLPLYYLFCYIMIIQFIDDVFMLWLSLQIMPYDGYCSPTVKCLLVSTYSIETSGHWLFAKHTHIL